MQFRSQLSQVTPGLQHARSSCCRNSKSSVLKSISSATCCSHLSEPCPAALVARKQEEWTAQGSQKNPELSGKAVCSGSFVDHLRHTEILSCALKAKQELKQSLSSLSNLWVNTWKLCMKHLSDVLPYARVYICISVHHAYAYMRRTSGGGTNA